MFELDYPSDSRLNRARLLLLEPSWRRLEDHTVSFISRDNSVKLLQVVSPTDGHAQLFQLKRAGVVDNVSSDDRLRVIAGEAVVGVYGWRKVIHHVAGGDGDFKAVGIAGWFFEFDRKFSRFFCLQKS